jgi:hypothetical protein
MNLLRSEEHIDLWLGDRLPGATLTLERLNELAHAWWHDRLSPDWRPHTTEQNQGILNWLGLTDEFWRLP